MAQTDNKQKNLLIGGAIMVLVIVAAIGVAVWVLKPDNRQVPNTGSYETQTPGPSIAQQPGSVAITPDQITLTRSPEGKLSAVATISALFQDFKIQSIAFNGDTRLQQTQTTCPTAGKILKAGARCQVTVVLNENASAAPAAATVPPSMVVSGQTSTPGGDSIVAEATAQITGAPPGAGAPNGAAGVPGAFAPGSGPITPGTGALTSGPVAGGGIDPYGPVAPTQGGATPPVDYSQAPVAAAQPMLSPREQFILARRQAVLGNIVRRPVPSAPQSTGDWDEIKVPKAVSSAPQDMSRIVTMDRIITAVLVRSFDSRGTQQVVAQVDRNVYGAMGRNILIPRGSTVIGTMQGGSERAVVAWTQIIRPDGARFVMNASGGDAMGQSGVPGYVNNRWAKRIGSVLLGTVLKVGTALASNASESPSQGTSVAIGGTGGTGAARNNGAIITDLVNEDINKVVQQIQQQNQNIQPIITVPAGTRVTIIPTQDLVMRPIDRPTIVRPSYPRLMNGGAPAPSFDPQMGGDEDAPSSGRRIDFNAPQQQPRRAPAQNAVQRGLSSPGIAAPTNTPPWASN